MLRVREPAVAGLFYPATADQLDYTIHQLFSHARQHRDLSKQSELTTAFSAPPKALIVPHAGYIYSGFCAAGAYLSLFPWASDIKQVAILGPAHRVFVEGFALPNWSTFATPFGEVPVNQSFSRILSDHPHAKISDRVHLHEHSIEVQLPFLQDSLQEFEIIPVAVGNLDDGSLDEVLEELIRRNVLLIVSTDLSHFLDYQSARALDAKTHRSILRLDSASIFDQQACGAIPLRALLRCARRHHWQVIPIEQCNSGDTAGDKERVVGYASYMFY